MSINWVMLDSNTKDFIRLPREKVLFTSPLRTSLTLQSPTSYPGKEPLSIKCGDGKAILTSQRLIYLPTTPNPTFSSFQSPHLSLQDTHVSAPFFGPNVWEGVLIPTIGGGIHPHHTLVQLKLTFKEGGAFDFATTFERIKETLSQAAEVARDSGRAVSGDVDLEQLPAYEEAAGGGGWMPPRQTVPAQSRAAPVTAQIQRPTPISPSGTAHKKSGRNGQDDRASKPAPTTSEPFPPPNEPPPGYEEAQAGRVVNSLEESITRSS